MDRDARNALSTIRRCIAADRLRLLPHFRPRLAERGMLWVDVLVVIDSPVDVVADGVDDWGRARWIISGSIDADQLLGFVCVLGRDAQGDLVAFITAFWQR